jgi:hypothetical protein
LQVIESGVQIHRGGLNSPLSQPNLLEFIGSVSIVNAMTCMHLSHSKLRSSELFAPGHYPGQFHAVLTAGTAWMFKRQKP